MKITWEGAKRKGDLYLTGVMKEMGKRDNKIKNNGEKNKKQSDTWQLSK